MSEITIRTVTVADAEALLKIYEYYVLNTAITFEYTNENGVLTDVSFTNKEYFSKNQEAARKLAGKPMDDTFFAEMRESVPIFGENELAYFLLEDATYQNAYGMLDGLINPQTATAEDFYSALEKIRELMWDNKELTDSERAYWREKVSEIETPFIYNRPWVATPLLFDFFYHLLDLLPLAVAICLCAIFSEDRHLRVEALVFSSKNSRHPLFVAKMLAGITGALLMTALVIGTTMITHFAVWGTEGLDASIQMADITSGLPISVLQVILAEIIWFISLAMVYAGLTMLTSVLTHSSISSFLVPVAVMLIVSDFITPTTSRIFDYLPQKLVGWSAEYNCRLMNIFGVQMNCLQFAPLLYGGIAIVLLVLCGFGWRRIASKKK